jgi:hypothetical protein
MTKRHDQLIVALYFDAKHRMVALNAATTNAAKRIFRGACLKALYL